MMVHGVRMEEAFNSQGVKISAKDVNEKGQNFQCIGCRTTVVHVTDHIINGQDPKIRRHVPAFFRLPSKGGTGHDTDCRFTPMGMVKKLVSSSRDVEKEVNPFSEENGTYYFRINIIANETEKGKSPQRSKGNERKEIPYGKRREMAWSGKKLSPYCKSAIGLAKIWFTIESQSDQKILTNNVFIKNHGVSIKWDDFFYSFARYKKLFRSLSKKSEHPIAVMIEVQKVYKQDNGSYTINCKPIQIKKHEKDTRISPIISIKKEEYASKFKENCRYIVFGDWYKPEKAEKIWPTPDGNKEITYVNVRVSIHNSSQFSATPYPDGGELENQKDT